MDTRQILKQHFGYHQFRPGQEIIIEQILDRHDVLAVMPTGGGKSLCYQIPALMQNGLTIVISPLIALMKDQVDSLNDLGIKAAYINSSLSWPELTLVMHEVRSGAYKLIYIAPERMENQEFVSLLDGLTIDLVAVDEAHCVSQWGHDFRPSYLRITTILDRLSPRPVVAAFTATATDIVKNDIKVQLGLHNPYELNTGIDRKNLYFEVVKPTDKFAFIADYLVKNPDNSGIIYCLTRKTVDKVWEKLQRLGVRVTRYHAGLSDKERAANQMAFINDQLPVMVATNAFGLGIDKSNLRFVLHYNMPKNIESYYQEAGRAGRDGEPARCMLLFSAADIITNKLLIENSDTEPTRNDEYKKLSIMADYCHTDTCLRHFIMRYFNENTPEQDCGNCGNCQSNIEKADITIEAQKIISCIKRMGERFGSSMVVNVLRGSQGAKIKELGFDQLSTYGIMKDYSSDTIKEIIAYLAAEGYLTVQGDKYPVLVLNSRSYAVVRGQETVYIRRVLKKQSTLDEKLMKPVDASLLTVLKKLRQELATEQGVPPYVVFSDASLHDMCRKYPTTQEAFLDISGVGNFKLGKYSTAFLAVIIDYLQQNNLQPPSLTETSKLRQQKRSTDTSAQADTRQVSYELYTGGKTIEDIMYIRGLTRQTIEGHLYDCLAKGLKVDYKDFIPAQHENAIIDAVKQYGTAHLKPIKEALPFEVTYGAIKFTILKHRL